MPGDATFTYGLATDSVVSGDWNDSGFDSVGVVRGTTSGVAQWTLDSNEDGTYDSGDRTTFFGRNTDTFIAGDWTGSGTTNIGIVRLNFVSGLEWVLDTSGTGFYEGGDAENFYGENGDTPVVGDWAGIGRDEMGVVRKTSSGVLEWILDSNGNGVYDSTDTVFFYGTNNDIPVVGDWSGTGRTEIGVIAPQANGTALWVLNTTGSGVYSSSDMTFSYGLATDKPVVGAWKPGALLVAAGGPQIGSAPAITADATFAAIVNDAILSWQQAGISSSLVSRLENVNYSVATLGNGVLGETVGNNIVIDSTAAGYGWSESAAPQAGHMDLFTTLDHEMGHILGLPDQTTNANDLMYEWLSTGVRKTPSTQDVDAAFAAMGR